MRMLHHIGVYVTDMERSKTFYETILTVKTREKLRFHDTELLFFKGEGFQLELIPDERSQSRTAHIAFAVSSVKAKIQELKQVGLNPSEGPYLLSNGWETVFYEGPDGEEIEFIQIQ
jgi:lactoylglutathione lyase